MTRHQFKVTVIGNSGVGKTSIVARFVDNVFREKHDATIGASYLTKIVLIENDEVKLCFWDTAGSERMKNLVGLYYRDSNGILLCFDITNRKSFEDIDYWIRDIKDKITEEGKFPVLYLIGLKSDLSLSRGINTAEILEYARHHRLPYYELSSKLLNETNLSEINKCFYTLASDMIERFPKKEEKKGITVTGDENKSYCCYY